MTPYIYVSGCVGFHVAVSGCDRSLLHSLNSPADVESEVCVTAATPTCYFVGFIVDGKIKGVEG